jgi:aldose 1-epimerase
VFVTYKISDDYKLSVTMHANPQNKPTPINLAQHSYWNLGGHSSGNILNHLVQIFASHITPVDSELIPTGEITSVDNTPFDFRKPMTVGSRISQVKGQEHFEIKAKNNFLTFLVKDYSTISQLSGLCPV